MGDSAYIVLQGCLSLDRMGRKVKTFSKREVFGIVVLLGIEPRPGTITAKEDSLLLELRAAEYFRDGLLAAGLEPNQRVICEEFSRDIRGPAPTIKILC